MDIKETQKLKKETENQILELLHKFEKETGLCIDAVDIVHLSVHCIGDSINSGWGQLRGPVTYFNIKVSL